MKKSQIERLLKKKIAAFLPGYLVNGRMFYRSNRTGILRAFYFDQSASNSSVVYAECFVLPLFVPTSVISFNFGYRLAHRSTRNTGWNLAIEDSLEVQSLVEVMAESAKSYLDRLETPKAFAEKFHATRSNDPHKCEAVAYAWTVCGETDKAMTVFSEISLFETQTNWEEEIKLRCSRVHKLMTSEGIEAAKSLLMAWQNETEVNLGLWTGSKQ